MTKDQIPSILSFPAVESVSILKSPMSCGMRSGFVALKIGESVGSHNTGEHEELIVVLDGVGEVEAEGIQEGRIGKGNVVYIPPNTQHNVFNRRSELLRYVYIVSPFASNKRNV